MATNIMTGPDFTSGWAGANITPANGTTGQSDSAGGTTAVKITPVNTGSASHNLAQNVGLSATPLVYVARLKAKASGYTGLQILMHDGTNGAYVGWDIVNGAMTYTGTLGSGFTLLKHSFDLGAGNGYGFASMHFQNNTAAFIQMQIAPLMDTGGGVFTNSFNGDGTSAILVDDPELYLSGITNTHRRPFNPNLLR